MAPIARDRAVPVLAFSTEKSVAGNGAYLLSFLPQNEVRRVVGYAAANGHHQFAALVPQTAYGDVTRTAFNDAVSAAHGKVVDVEHFAPNAGDVAAPSDAVVKSGADAVLIAAGRGDAARHRADPVVPWRRRATRSSFLGTGPLGR